MISAYKGKNAIVTGGLGFIGSNLAIRLVKLGARVSILDAEVPGCGANEANLRPVWGNATLMRCDLGEPERFAGALESADVIFNLAGEISHSHSMKFPERDAALNAISQLRFLQACARWNPGIRVVYAGTRQIYGRPQYLPVDENHPAAPVDFNGIHKNAAVQYHLLHAALGQLDTVVLHLTNVYGPRMALNAGCQGFLGTYLKRLLLRQPLEIFGDGCQLRDPLYVDDAVDAFLLAGAVPRVASRVYNVGGPAALSLRKIAKIAHDLAGGPVPVFRPFPASRKSIDIGSYWTDSSRIGRELGWYPVTGFVEGMARALAFYQEDFESYVGPGVCDGECGLEQDMEPAAARAATQP